MSYRTIEYDSWNEFMRDYAEDIFKGIYMPNIYIFRGQKDADWSLISSFDRKYSSRPWLEREKIENELIQLFKQNCDRANWPINSDDMGIKSLAQHYGIPTRLLDWSYSPFIAAYFAFSSHEIDTYGKVAIWALKKDHEIWKSEIGVSIKEIMLPENDHQKRQLGCFSLIKNQELSVDGFVNSCEKKGYDIEDALFKMTIPSSEFKTALFELEAMNISATTIYGGLAGCAQAANDLVKLKYSS